MYNFIHVVLFQDARREVGCVLLLYSQDSTVYTEFSQLYERIQHHDGLCRIPHPCVQFGVTCGASGHLISRSEFPFDKYSTVVDVGGGIGSFSLDLAKQYKHIKVTLQDLPEALAQAREVSTLLQSSEAILHSSVSFGPQSIPKQSRRIESSSPTLTFLPRLPSRAEISITWVHVYIANYGLS